MLIFRNFVFACVLMTLSACAGVGVIGAVINGTPNPVTPGLAFTLHTTFKDTLLIPSRRYALLPRCSVHAFPCSSQTVINGMRKYLNPAEAAIERLDAWATHHGNIDGSALYQAALDAIAAAKDFGIKHGIPGVVP